MFMLEVVIVVSNSSSGIGCNNVVNGIAVAAVNVTELSFDYLI